jgi:ribosomal protein S27AE
MTCPACGTTMNHHADKLDYTESGAAASRLGGVVKEVHTCPRCGNVEMRTADESAGPKHR